MTNNNSEARKKTIESVLKQHARRLMRIHGVAAVAQGKWEGKPCIKVFVTKSTEELMQRIPSEIEGYTVRVEESGTFKALGTQ